ncbi:DUF3761 domain-containing protein [Pseudoduganella sp. FT26W]|uniref:DUF3761 domain-containing protein n=1 Tax=Duganella aquatilis TaxID=2666082 RepID=A0A844CZJ2_9BURK|nr:DUF3761 domain-containing protein [Duganella aquatilis]MRW82935.1 DUF3761 domain-containing protein [Duganella aquatilis]
MKTIVIYLSLIVLISLTGCGGGNGGDDTVQCKDGWISHSKDKQGACSSHGGVA